jgi:HTH-type transcriptional regulator/antitoxin HigA
MMDIRPIRTEADYDWALQEVEQYFENEPKPGTAAADRFDVLAALIEAYEAREWPIEPPDPVAAIKEVMERMSFKPADLGRLLGSRSRASEILNRQRALTMNQAWMLHTHWHIPAEVLLRPTNAEAESKPVLT